MFKDTQKLKMLKVWTILY